MNLLALVQSGFPPIGNGLYVRSTVRGLPAARWHAVLAWRRDAEEQVEALGAKWMWGGVDHFRPGRWEAGLRFLADKARATGCEGIIVDPENGWPDIPRAERRSQLTAFGRALSDTALDLRVGITSYPLFPDLDILASAAGDGCWGSIQLYGRSSYVARTTTRTEAMVMGQWWQRWADAFGSRLIPSVAVWDSGYLHTSARYQEYLSALPKAHGSIGWLAGTPPAHIRAGFESYNAGGSALGTVAIAIANWVGRPAGIAVVAIIAVVGAALAAGIVKVAT